MHAHISGQLENRHSNLAPNVRTYKVGRYISTCITIAAPGNVFNRWKLVNVAKHNQMNSSEWFINLTSLPELSIYSIKYIGANHRNFVDNQNVKRSQDFLVAIFETTDGKFFAESLSDFWLEDSPNMKPKKPMDGTPLDIHGRNSCRCDDCNLH